MVFCLFVLPFFFFLRIFIRTKYPRGKVGKEEEVTVYHGKAEQHFFRICFRIAPWSPSELPVRRQQLFLPEVTYFELCN